MKLSTRLARLLHRAAEVIDPTATKAEDAIKYKVETVSAISFLPREGWTNAQYIKAKVEAKKALFTKLDIAGAITAELDYEPVAGGLDFVEASIKIATKESQAEKEG